MHRLSSDGKQDEDLLWIRGELTDSDRLEWFFSDELEDDDLLRVWREPVEFD